VREGRTELLFWKKELLGYSKIQGPIFSRAVPRWSVIQIWVSGSLEATSTAAAVVEAGGSESRRISETPFL
jgi:hypothetical protein